MERHWLVTVTCVLAWSGAVPSVAAHRTIPDSGSAHPNEYDSLALHVSNLTIPSYPILEDIISDHGKVRKRSAEDLEEAITRISNDANAEAWSELNDRLSVESVSIQTQEKEGHVAPDVTVNYGNSSFTIPGHLVPMGRRPQQSSRERRQLHSGEDEGRSCTTPSQEVGFCKDLADCPDLILDLTTLRRSVCFKSIFIPGVCCPKSGQRSDDVPSTTTRRPLPPPRRTTPRPVNTRPPVRPRPVPANDAVARPPVPAPHPNSLFRCGTARIPEKRVVGGVESPRGKWPWMAAIFLHGPKKTEFWCGASLVSAKFVLTAAHCTKDPNGKTFNPQQFTVRLGDHNIFSHSDDHLSDPSTLRVADIKPHPDFKARGFYNDVALIKLADEVLFNDYTAPICLPPPEMAARGLDDLVGQTPTVIGYGSTHYDGTESPVLREARLPVWRNADCDQAYLQPITDIFLCAGYVEGGTDACQGDSGGPLLLFGPSKQWIQIGIVSFGNRCAEPGYPGVYTRLTKFMPWIHDNMLL